ncbi:MAG: hypothetical protein U9Q03_03870 [Patescibacteria group bacterium]|nr:hypothetical protein [Patescibacteria group bacterium]
MSRMIIIRGPLGVGKSTVSLRVAKALNADYFSVDEILVEKGLDFCDGEPCIPLSNFVQVNDKILADIHRSRQGAVVDGNFYHADQLEDLTERHVGPVHVFTLKAPVESCIERDGGRREPHGEAAARAVHGLVSGFDAGVCVETGGKGVGQVVDQILEELGLITAE